MNEESKDLKKKRLKKRVVNETPREEDMEKVYAEEEVRRGAEERRKNEAQAISRWYQLLSSIVTRQRLNNRYAEGVSSNPSNDTKKQNDTFQNHTSTSNEDIQKLTSHQEFEDGSQHDNIVQRTYEEDHEHVFITNDSSFDGESSIRTKRCRCGFSIEVEEF
ncbi:hypothetical protein Tco_0970827 [Tanacetum coccineum]